MRNHRGFVLALFVAGILAASSIVSFRPADASQSSAGLTEESGSATTENIVLPTASPTASRTSIAHKGSNGLSLHVARAGHTLTTLPDGRVAVIGGRNEDGAVAATEIVDVNSQSVRVAAQLRVARSRHTTTVLPDGSLLVAGGWDDKEAFNSTEVFDAQTQSFSKGPRLNRARAAHSATTLADGRVLIAGGTSDGSAETYEPMTGRFTLLNSRMNEARSFHGAAVLSNGNVLVVGGVDQDGVSLNTAEIFEVRTNRFVAISRPMLIKRVRPTLRVLPDGKIQVIGGDPDGTMEVYDPATNRFGAAAHLTPTAAIFATSRVLESQTRSAFIDSKISLDISAQADASRPLNHYSASNKVALDSFGAMLERSDYSEIEVPNANRAMIAGGLDRAGRPTKSVIITDSSPASLTTNKVEFQFGDVPAISGSGWAPGELITIVRQEARPDHKRITLRATADDNGNFRSSELGVTNYKSGVSYTLTAMGETSAYVAQTTYRDARAPSAPRPKTAKLNIPILFRDAAFEHEEGILIWTMKANKAMLVKPPARPQDGVSFNHTFDFASLGIADQPCLGIPDLICPLPDGVDLRLKSGSSITFGGGIDATIDENGGTISLSENVSGNLIVQIDLTGTITIGPIPIPGASIGFNATIPDTDIGLEAVLGIVVRIDVTFNDPGTTFVTTLAFSENATVGFSVDVDGFGPFATGSISGSASLDKVDSRGGCVKLSVGPELSVEAGLDLKVCNIGVNAAANFSPFIEGCFNVDLTGCPSYSIPLSIGLGGILEGGVDFCIFDFGDDFPFELFKFTFAEFTGLLPETQPPVITCLPGVTAVAPQTCPPSGSTSVSFAAPTVTDNCPNPTFVCSPASGSVFPVGVTTVSCTATDIWNNKSSCAFALTAMNGCVQDDSNSANAVIFNSTTGDYQFCAGGTTYTGKGTVNQQGCVLTIQHNTPTRRVLIQTDYATKRASASLQSPPGSIKATVTDRNITNNTCSCVVTPPPPPPAGK